MVRSNTQKRCNLLQTTSYQPARLKTSREVCIQTPGCANGSDCLDLLLVSLRSDSSVPSPALSSIGAETLKVSATAGRAEGRPLGARLSDQVYGCGV